MLGLGSKLSRNQPRKRLGEMLLEDGIIKQDELRKGLDLQRQNGGFIGQILVENNALDAKTLTTYLVKQCKIPHLSLLDYEIGEQTLSQVPKELCLKHYLMPIDKLGRILTLAMVDPLDTDALDEVKRLCPDLRIKPMLCTWDHFQAVAKRVYGEDPQQPEGMQDKYAQFGLSAPVESTPPPGKAPEPTPQEEEAHVVQEMPKAASKSPDIEEPAILEAEDRDVEPIPETKSHPSLSPSPTPELYSIDSAALSREIASAISGSVREAMAILIADAATSGKDGSSATTDTSSVAAAVRDALEGAMEVFSDELRQERELLRAELATVATTNTAGDSISADALTTALQGAVSAPLDAMLSSVSTHLGEVGDAIKRLGETSATPNVHLAETLQKSVTDAVQQTTRAMVAEMRALTASQPTGDGEKGVDPMLLADLVRNGISEALGNALESMSANIQSLLNLQSGQPSVHDAVHALQQHLSENIQTAMSGMATQFQVAAAAAAHENATSIATLVQTMSASITETLAANQDAQKAQQSELTRIAQAALDAMSENRDTERQEMVAAAKTILAAVGNDSRANMEIQERIASISQATLEAVSGAREDERQELTTLAAAMLAAIENEKTANEERREQLASVAQATLEAVSGNTGAGKDELMAVANAILAAVENDKSAHTERQEQLAAIAQAALDSVRQTSQLIEAHTVAENNRSDLMRRRQAKHAGVSSFGGQREENASDLQLTEDDTRVRGALDSDSPRQALTFDNFFVGEKNTFTVKLAKAVAAAPGGEYNPLFLFGKVGIGKTHLISAIGNAILSGKSKGNKSTPLRVGYISASHFARHLSAALADNALEAFRDNYCLWDTLILDDIQFLGGRVEAQEEFFHIFNVLLQEERQIIIAADKAPDRLGMLEQRLVSRFSSGIVAELTPPEYETRMAILRHMIGEVKVSVPEEILTLVAMRVADDTRKMMGALRKIIAFSRMDGGKMSVENAQQILSHLGGTEAA